MKLIQIAFVAVLGSISLAGLVTSEMLQQGAARSEQANALALDHH